MVGARRILPQSSRRYRAKKMPWIIFFIILSQLYCLPSQAQTLRSDGAQIESRLQKLEKEQIKVSSDVSKLTEKAQETESSFAKIEANKEIISNQIAMQDKRIGDLGLSTSQQANYMGAISNLSAIVGIGITVVFSLMSIITGVVVYFSAQRKAITEAQQAAKEWLSANSASLTRQIEELHNASESLRSDTQTTQSNALEAIEEIHRLKAEVASHAVEARKKLDNAAQEIMFSAAYKGSSYTVDNSKNIEIVQQANDVLIRKPEIDFTSHDHFARGFSEYISNRYDSALVSFKKSLSLLDIKSSNPEDIAKTMFAIAIAHGDLDERDKEIETYDKIEAAYKDSDNPVVREHVAMALVNKGIRLEHAEKLKESLAAHEEVINRYGGDDHLPLRVQTLVALTCKAGIVCKLGDPKRAVSICDEIGAKFGSQSEPSIRLKLARSRNLRAFSNILISKIKWNDEDVRRSHLVAAVDELQSVLESTDVEHREILLGNLGYAQHLLNDHENAYIHTLSCLQLGGERSLELQKNDALQYRIEEPDHAYEELLAKAWSTLAPAVIE